MDRGAWKAAVHGVAEGQTWLSDFTFPFHFHASEKEMATHSSVLASRIPGMGEPGRLPSMGSHRVGHDWSDLAAAAAASSTLLLLKAGRLWSYALPFCVHRCTFITRTSTHLWLLGREFWMIKVKCVQIHLPLVCFFRRIFINCFKHSNVVI